MWILGITGGIGAGKSTLSKSLQEMGIPVHSADQEIHNLIDHDLAIQEKIRSFCPQAFVEGKIDRSILGEWATSSENGLSRLEKILFPHLAKRQKKFLQYSQNKKDPIVALDIPLLFEVGLDKYCHFVILASTPHDVRKKRVLERSGMTPQKLKVFESHQLKEEDKRKKSDVIIDCSGDKGNALRKLKETVKCLMQKESPKWDGKWPTNLQRKLHGSRNRP